MAAPEHGTHETRQTGDNTLGRHPHQTGNNFDQSANNQQQNKPSDEVHRTHYPTDRTRRRLSRLRQPILELYNNANYISIFQVIGYAQNKDYIPNPLLVSSLS